MSEEPSLSTPLELRRRLRRIYACALCFLIPFALTMVGAWAHAPKWYLVTTFAGTWVGLAFWMIRYYQLSRCPACNALLTYLFQSPPMYERCPYCHVSFR